MPTINLTDNLGLSVDISPLSFSMFSKYLKHPSAIFGALRNLKDIRALQIGQDPFESQSAGLSWIQPVALGATGMDLAISPQFNCSLEICKDGALFDKESDPFREAVAIPVGQAYLCGSFEAKLSLSLGDSPGEFLFGFAASGDIAVSNYRLFALTDPMVGSLKTLFEGYVLPRDLQDIEAMAQGSLATVDGTGTIRFSGQANLLSSVNPLGGVTIPVVNETLGLQEGASVTVGASYTLTGEYQIRVQRLDGRKFRLSFLKKRSSEFDVSVTADIGVSGSIGSFDIIQKILQSVSADPVPDKDTFSKSGLGDDQIATIASALKAGIERSLQLSVSAQLDSLSSSSSAFSFEIDLELLDSDGTEAVNGALHGKLTGLEGGALKGVRLVQSIFSSLRQGTRSLKINLLGIYNYGSVTQLFQSGTMIVDHDSGEITVADKAGADRITFSSDNFVKDSAKLRRVLAESLLFTVAYRASRTVRSGPKFSARYGFFELKQSTRIENLQDYLNIAECLGLLTPADANARLAPRANSSGVGPSTFYADASFNDAACENLFLDMQGGARAEAEYQGIGRHVLSELLRPGDSTTRARMVALKDDAIWAKMSEVGSPNDFSGLFNGMGFNLVELGDISSDYILITWWSGAMRNMSVSLAGLLAYLKQNSGWSPLDAKFLALRGDLEKKLAAVAANTQSQFSEPWGLVAMYIASGKQAARSMRLVCSKLTLLL